MNQIYLTAVVTCYFMGQVLSVYKVYKVDELAQHPNAAHRVMHQ